MWLRRQRARVSPRSRLGEKLAYIGNRWDGLQMFLTDGRVEMDNNVIENAIRPLALNRKNALFAGHDEGAPAWARIVSLIKTAKMNRINPYAYLKATLEAIASGHPHSDIDALMPWPMHQHPAEIHVVQPHRLPFDLFHGIPDWAIRAIPGHSGFLFIAAKQASVTGVFPDQFL